MSTNMKDQYFQSIGGTLYLNKTESNAYMDLFNRSAKIVSTKGITPQKQTKNLNIPSKANKMVLTIIELISITEDLLILYKDMSQIKERCQKSMLAKKSLQKTFRKKSSELGSQLHHLYEVLFQGEVQENELLDLGYEESVGETRIILLKNHKVLKMVLEDWMKKNGVQSFEELEELRNDLPGKFGKENTKPFHQNNKPMYEENDQSASKGFNTGLKQIVNRESYDFDTNSSQEQDSQFQTQMYFQETPVQPRSRRRSNKGRRRRLTSEEKEIRKNTKHSRSRENFEEEEQGNHYQTRNLTFLSSQIPQGRQNKQRQNFSSTYDDKQHSISPSIKIHNPIYQTQPESFERGNNFEDQEFVNSKQHQLKSSHNHFTKEPQLRKTDTEQRFDVLESTLMKIMEKLESLDKPQTVDIFNCREENHQDDLESKTIKSMFTVPETKKTQVKGYIDDQDEEDIFNTHGTNNTLTSSVGQYRPSAQQTTINEFSHHYNVSTNKNANPINWGGSFENKTIQQKVNESKNKPGKVEYIDSFLQIPQKTGTWNESEKKNREYHIKPIIQPEVFKKKHGVEKAEKKDSIMIIGQENFSRKPLSSQSPHFNKTDSKESLGQSIQNVLRSPKHLKEKSHNLSQTTIFNQSDYQFQAGSMNIPVEHFQKNQTQVDESLSRKFDERREKNLISLLKLERLLISIPAYLENLKGQLDVTSIIEQQLLQSTQAVNDFSKTFNFGSSIEDQELSSKVSGFKKGACKASELLDQSCIFEKDTRMSFLKGILGLVEKVTNQLLDALNLSKGTFKDIMPESLRSFAGFDSDEVEYEEEYASGNDNEEYFEMNEQLKKKLSDRDFVFNQHYTDSTHSDVVSYNQKMSNEYLYNSVGDTNSRYSQLSQAGEKEEVIGSNYFINNKTVNTPSNFAKVNKDHLHIDKYLSPDSDSGCSDEHMNDATPDQTISKIQSFVNLQDKSINMGNSIYNQPGDNIRLLNTTFGNENFFQTNNQVYEKDLKYNKQYETPESGSMMSNRHQQKEHIYENARRMISSLNKENSLQERSSVIHLQSLVHNEQPIQPDFKKHLERVPSEELSTNSPTKRNEPQTNPNSGNRISSGNHTYPSPMAHYNTLERAMLDSQSLNSGSKPKPITVTYNPSFKFEEPPTQFETLSRKYPAVTGKEQNRFSKNYDLDIAIESLISTARENKTGYEVLEDFINPGSTLIQNLEELNQENAKDQMNIQQFKKDVIDFNSGASNNNFLKNNQTFGKIALETTETQNGVISVRQNIISPKLKKIPIFEHTEELSGARDCRVLFSINEDLMALGFETGHIIFFNILNKKIEHVFKEHQGAISTFELAYIMVESNCQGPEKSSLLVPKRILLSGSTKPDNLVLAWDLDKMKPFKRLTGHSDSISMIKDLQDEATVVTASFDSKIAFWELRKNFKCIQLLNNITSPVLCMEYDSCSQKLLAGCLDSSIMIWNLHFDQEQGGLYTDCSFLKKFFAVDIPIDLGISSSFQSTLIAIEQDGIVRLYDIDDPQDGTCLKKIKIEGSVSGFDEVQKIKDFIVVERGDSLNPVIFLMDEDARVCKFDHWDLNKLKQSTFRDLNEQSLCKPSTENEQERQFRMLNDYQFRPKQQVIVKDQKLLLVTLEKLKDVEEIGEGCCSSLVLQELEIQQVSVINQIIQFNFQQKPN